MTLIERSAGWGLLLLPGALIVYLGFNAGGYFPGTPALVAVVLVLVLAARILAAERPFAGFSKPLAVCGGALVLYALWTLLSASWSDSTWRALVEFDRVLVYLLALAIYGSIPRRASRVRWMLRGVALGILIVCVAGLISRILPEVWPISANINQGRLSYPITYWNALGILAAIGTILSFHFACSRSEPPLIRVLGAGTVPILATTLYFTVSRGAILAGAIGLVAYPFLARPRGFIAGALASLPAAALSVLVSYHADELTSEHPTTQAAIEQGHHVAAVLAGCVIGALAVRTVLLLLDAQIDRLLPPPHLRRPLFASVAVAAAAATIVFAVALDAPGYASRQYDRFAHGDQLASTGNARERLSNPGNNGRIDHWDVALDEGYGPASLEGQGAGTYETVWAQNRPRKLAGLSVRDAHSLYVENLSDLGLIGFALVLVFVLTILWGFAARLGGPNRTLYAALFAAGLAWAVHAGIDWDWEMPGVTLWFFAIGGAALAAPLREPWIRRSPPLLLRAGLALALLLVAVIPARVTISQGRLDQALSTFLSEGDCPVVIREADDAASVLESRPDPYRLAGYCQARIGRPREAVASMKKAVARDPDNWAYHYSLAVAQGAAGIDPRPAAKEALRLDPWEAATQDLVGRFVGPNRGSWKLQAQALLRAPLF